MHVLNHKHILISAFNLKAPPRTGADVDAWLGELVTLVDMELLMGPYSVRCDDVGNEGATGVVCIKTSHSSLHCWDAVDEPFLKMDLYSCKDFDPNVVLQHLEKFQPESADVLVIDRNGKHATIIEHVLANFSYD